MSKYLEPGDVFKAIPAFEFAYDESDKPYKKGETILDVSDVGEVNYIRTKTKGYDPKTGIAIKVITHDHEHFNKSRVRAEYVVEEVIDMAASEREFIQSEPKVVARRLAKDGTYDPKGELITFVDLPTGQISNYSNSATVEVHRKMKRVFV